MLEISQLEIHLEFTTPADLPYWMGSAFRGVFGRELRNLVCTTHLRCEDCGRKDDCLYYYLYERRTSRRGHAPPVRPIIVIPPFFGRPMHFEEKGRLKIDLLLFGDFIEYLPHALLALIYAGNRGIGAARHYGQNRFVVKKAVCAFTGNTVFDGNTIYMEASKKLDVLEIEPFLENTITIGFRTPYTGRVFPPDAYEFLDRIRNRLIRYVNEYGSGEEVPAFQASGNVFLLSKHFHNLQRRSSRSDKRVFPAHTGVVRYEYDGLDTTARWLISTGLLTGLGPDASFGCGFLKKM